MKYFMFTTILCSIPGSVFTNSSHKNLKKNNLEKTTTLKDNVAGTPLNTKYIPISREEFYQKIFTKIINI